MLIIVFAYLLGSIPAAYLVTRLVTGADIRHLGDGNMGAKNTFHSVGWLPAVLVAVVDVGKGALAVATARYFNASEGLVMLAGACAVLGHDFPVYLAFRGGQGMATMIGVFGVLYPQLTILALLALLAALAITRNWDISSALSFVLLVLMIWLAGQPLRRLLYPVLLLPTIGLRKLLQQWQARRLAV